MVPFMTVLVLPQSLDSITSIGENAFQNCSCLTSIIFPASLNFLADSAFWDCSNLSSIKVSNSYLHYFLENGVRYYKDPKEAHKSPNSLSKVFAEGLCSGIS